MSVTTTADENREETQCSVKSAITTLTQFLDEDTWGHDNYKKEYIENCEDALILLIKVRKLIRSSYYN